MCGRYALHASSREIARALGTESAPDSERSYNIPPGTYQLAAHASGHDVSVAFERIWWGYRPPWANDDAPQPINARAEKVATSPYFRHAFTRHRCLIPASGWFEWHQGDEGKLPYYITTEADVLMFAGIYDPTREEGGSGSFAIITQPAARTIAHIHSRMPLVLDAACYQDWLNPAHQDRDSIKALTRPVDPRKLVSWPVDRRVNRPANNDATLIEPAE